jgi:hypothetical protein
MIDLADEMCSRARAILRFIQKDEFKDAFKNNPDTAKVESLIKKGDVEGIKKFMTQYRSSKYSSRSELVQMGKTKVKNVHRLKKREILAKLGV